MAGTRYMELLEAIEKYYGQGSDQWVEVAKYGTNAENFQSIVKQLPNYRCVVNQNGKVISYEKFDAISADSTTAANINSNLQGAATKTKIKTPATTGIDSQTSKVTATKGISTTSGTQFISKSVIPAIAAAGVGITLGKTIDSALYNANPDFWNSHNMQGLDPATWSDITTGMDGSVSAGLFNLLFGIYPATNRGQVYIEQDAFAYLALYMATMGVFDDVSQTNIGTIPDDFHVVNPITRGSVMSTETVQRQYWDTQTGQYELETLVYKNVITTSSGVYSTYMLETNGDNYRCKIVNASNEPYTYALTQEWTNLRTGETGIIVGGSGSARQFNYNGRTVYFSAVEHLGTNRDTPTYKFQFTVSGAQSSTLNMLDAYDGELAYMMIFSQYDDTALDGIGNQTGATLPQLDPNASVADTLAALQSQYPDLFRNSVTYPVLQPDGTVTNYTYIPTAYPSITSNQDTHPTGGTDNSTQSKPYYDPAADMDDAFTSLWDMFNNEGEYVDDDEGDGDTPVVVPPTGSASALYKIYNPSQAQLDAFGAWLWSPDFVDQLLKLFSDPMQAIIGLHKVFVTPPVSGSGAIKVGYLTSTASANYVSGQYVTVDCGTVTLSEKFGNVFDYSPFTKINIYLPFIGFRELETGDVIRGKVGVVYHVDVLTGACLVEVKVTRDNSGGTIYTFSGNCAVQYPISSGSYVGIITGLLGIAGGIAGSIASGGALAPMLMGAGASIGAMHTNVEHSGNISSNTGAMGIKKPYIVISRPQTKMPLNGETIEGLPENKVVTLGSVKGFVRVKKTHYDGIPCTAIELDKIKALLENGVYIN